MSRIGTTDLVVALAIPEHRIHAAQELATRLGAEQLLVLLCDSAVNAMVPAPGFAQTLRGGPSWREFLKRCLEFGKHDAHVEFPVGRWCACQAIVQEGFALILINGGANPDEMSVVTPLLPLLYHGMRQEQQVVLARYEAEAARGAASRSQVLARALEAARREGAKLNTQLRDEHRRKDEFLAMLAHELRNPLAPLVTSLEVLKRRGATAVPEHERLFEIMVRQTTHLSRLVDDLLDISRVTRGKVELRRQVIPLWEIVSNSLEANAPLITARRHEVKLVPPPEPIRINADPVRLTQVLSNLIHNAAKYTHPGGRIEIQAETDHGEAVLRISDNGIGIAEEMLQAVFDLFAQVPSAMGQSQGGLGIGLTLVKSLVELHGGRVSAQSPGVGKGSTFCLRLPLMNAAPDSGPHVPEHRVACE